MTCCADRQSVLPAVCRPRSIRVTRQAVKRFRRRVPDATPADILAALQSAGSVPADVRVGLPAVFFGERKICRYHADMGMLFRIFVTRRGLVLKDCWLVW